MNSTKKIEEMTKGMQRFIQMLLMLFVIAVALTTIAVLIAIKTGIESFTVIAITVELIAIFLICASLVIFTIINIKDVAKKTVNN